MISYYTYYVFIPLNLAGVKHRQLNSGSPRSPYSHTRLFCCFTRHTPTTGRLASHDALEPQATLDSHAQHPRSPRPVDDSPNSCDYSSLIAHGTPSVSQTLIVAPTTFVARIARIPPRHIPTLAQPRRASR